MPLTNQKIEDTVCAIVAEILCIEEEAVKLSIDLPYREAGLDSLDAVECIISIEEEFNIHVPDDEVEDAATVRDMVRFVQKALSASTVA